MTTQQRVDLFIEKGTEYDTPRHPVVITTTPALYLAIASQGPPGGHVFEERLAALYDVAFAVKIASQRAGRDYRVCPLESLWWGARKSLSNPQEFLTDPREQWNSLLMTRTPEFITEHHLHEVIEPLLAKNRPELEQVTLKRLNEGLAVQGLDVGVGETSSMLCEIQALVRAEGLEPNGLLHEIHLAGRGPGETEDQETILRIPVRRC
jgi:hypothetical protein